MTGFSIRWKMDRIRYERVEDEYKLQFYNLRMEEPKEKPLDYMTHFAVQGGYLRLSVFCDWRFTNLDHSFEKMMGCIAQ